MVKLDVPYIHQVLDIGSADSNWACGPTSVVMILAYYGKLAPWPQYLAQEGGPDKESRLPTSESSRTPGPTAGTTALSGPSFAPYVTTAYSVYGRTYSATALDPQGKPVAGLYGAICPTGSADWSSMTAVLGWHGLSARRIPATWEGVVAALKRGHPVLLGNNLTEAGHILVATGYTANGHLIVNDPYGNRFAPNYGRTNGRGLLYPWNCTRARTAVEVIGVYPPPSPTVPTTTSTASTTSTSVPATSTTSTTSATATIANPTLSAGSASTPATAQSTAREYVIANGRDAGSDSARTTPARTNNSGPISKSSTVTPVATLVNMEAAHISAQTRESGNIPRATSFLWTTIGLLGLAAAAIGMIGSHWSGSLQTKHSSISSISSMTSASEVTPSEGESVEES